MPVVYPSIRPRSDHEKNAEEKKKLLNEYQQKIQNNASKWPNYKLNDATLHLHNLLIEYIGSFGIEKDNQ